MPVELPLVRVDNVTIKFPVRTNGKTKYITPIDGVSMDIAAGEVLSLVGESGSGKTTLGRALVRINEPTSGQIYVDGQEVTHVKRKSQLNELRRSTQMVFQDPFGSLNPVKTVAQHLRVIVQKHSNLRGRQVEERVVSLLETVGLIPGREIMVKYPHEMSGGQRQRVAIARALAVNPKFIVADEPISMLDVSIRADILKLLNQLKTEFNLAYLYITHDLASAKYFGDRIMVLYGGKVMESAEANELVKAPVHPYTQLLLSCTAGSSIQQPIGETSLESPDLFEGRQGCPFAHRCVHVTDRCLEEVPELRTIGEGHVTACHNLP